MKLLIAIPAYNEEKIIEKNITELKDFCSQSLSYYDWKIVVADNSSTDATKAIILGMAKRDVRIQYLYVSQKGKGLAIARAWLGDEADIYVFMDADLAVDLSALPFLVDAIGREGYDMAYGSRYHRDSKVQRTILRRAVSLIYRMLLKIALATRIHDAPCGFKAINQKIKNEILPKARSKEWFFDSELIILSEKLGCKIKEIPVLWEEKNEKGRKSRVGIVSLGIEYTKKVIELRRRIKALL